MVAAHSHPPRDTWGQLPGFTSSVQWLSSRTRNVGASGQDGHWGASLAIRAGHHRLSAEKERVARPLGRPQGPPSCGP